MCCCLVAKSFPTLCDPMDCSLPGSSVYGILQARILKWVAVPFSRGSSWPSDWLQVSKIVGRLFTIWATREAPFKGMCIFIFILFIFSVAPVWHVELPWAGIEPGFPTLELCSLNHWTIREVQRLLLSCILSGNHAGETSFEERHFQANIQTGPDSGASEIEKFVTPNSIPAASRKRSRTPTRALRCQKSP